MEAETQGRPTSSTCPLQSCPLTPSVRLSAPDAAAARGSTGHRDPTCATERDGPCVLTTVRALLQLFFLHNPIFKIFWINIIPMLSHLPLLSTCKLSTVGRTPNQELGLGL